MTHHRLAKAVVSTVTFALPPGTARTGRRRAPHAGRPAFFVPLLLAGALPLNALALVTVPGDYATVQAAVDAAQVSADPKVVINSNANFNENLVVTDTVEIVAGDGFSPTITGDSANGTVYLSYTGTTGQILTLEGLKLRNSGGSSPWGIVHTTSAGTSAGIVYVYLNEVDVESTTGRPILTVRNDSASTSHNVTIGDSQLRMTAAGPSSGSMVQMNNKGQLMVVNSTFDLTGGGGVFDLRGGTPSTAGAIAFRMEESVLNVTAPLGPYSNTAVSLLNNVGSTLVGNQFNFTQPGAGGSSGIHISGATNGQTHTISHNRFTGQGERSGSGVSVAPHWGDHSVTATIFNNVMHRLDYGIQVSPQSPGDTATVVALNNTIDDAYGCLSLGANTGTTINGRFENNLCTNIEGESGSGEEGSYFYGAIGAYAGTGSTLTMSFANNGFHNNAHGNYAPTVASIPDVGEAFSNADPRYVNRAAGDLRLYTGSPAIDAGRDQRPLVTDDAAWTPRPQGAAFDIGAYEGGETPPPGGSGASVTPVPTLGQWTLLGLGLLAAGLGGVQLRRRG